MNSTDVSSQSQVNWRQVGLFVALTFAFTYLLDWGLFLVGGLRSPGAIVIIQLQMMLPAFFAILLGMFVFSDGPFHYRSPLPDGLRSPGARLFLSLYSADAIFLCPCCYLGARTST